MITANPGSSCLRKVRISLFRGVLTGVLPLIMLFQCTDMQLAGSISETTNGKVAGVIVNRGGPVFGAHVAILPLAFNPVHDSLPEPWQTTTDEEGAYELQNIRSGDYNIIARRNDSAVLIRSLTITPDQQNVEAPPGMLAPTGSIRVPFALAEENPALYFYLPGTDAAATVSFSGNTAGEALFSGVPAGLYPDLYGDLTVSGAPSNYLTSAIEIVPAGSVTVGSFQAWQHSRSIILNTTVSGASVTRNVFNFPVCIRLTAKNFDFAIAAGNGSDIRIAKPDNTPLSCQIEFWDSVNNTAVLWVRVDTVYGSSLTRLYMYWGNETVSSVSNGEAVFDTARGFQGVWHLGEPVSALAKDATGNHFNGTPSVSPPLAVPGIIGRSNEFNGTSSFFQMNNTASGALDFPEYGTYSISAWVSIDSLDSNFHAIAAKGGYQYNLEMHESKQWEAAEYINNVGWEVVVAPAVARQWTFLTSVRNGNRLSLYVNGMCVDSLQDTAANHMISRTIKTDFTIGKILWDENKNGNYFYNGKIDEVRVSSVAQSPDWIKLCYMNQKEDDRLVTFE